MRSGVCAVQQALTTEVASVLKHSLDLARRRGHAQVTPLHVAATLMSSSSTSSDLLRRACLKSQPHHPSSHPLQCRALELCFNVALNRLPTTSPPSGTLIPSPSSLSNSLIAALKRAQANQRRGCIELQQQQLQQQPLLSIKVEMDQLMLSILDDPSVSRVMKEAGFSSSCVKNNLEEEASALSRCSPFLWQSPPQKEDLEMVMEVMLRRANTVVVGDSASMTQGLVTELMSRLERGEVPGELKLSSFINLQFSSAHLRVMSKGDVELKVSDLRRTINSLASDSVVIYAGDLRWAVDEEGRDGRGFNPVEHMVAEMGRLLCEFKCSTENKVSLLATSSYGTYMRCQMRQPSLEALWALQAVVVPSGWLALSPQASSSLDSTRDTKFGQFPFQLLEPQVLRSKEDEKFICCAECTLNLEKECSDIKSKTSWWLQGSAESNHKQVLIELRRKWNKLCRSLHRNRTHLWPPLFNQSLISKGYCKSITNSWWPTGLFSNQDKNFIQPHSVSFSAPAEKFNAGFSSTIADKKKEKGCSVEKFLSVQWSSEASLNSVKMSANQQIKTSPALSTPLLSDSATSKDQTSRQIADPIELQRQLQDEIPWQSNAIPSIMEAIHEGLNGDKKAIRLLIRGSDNIVKRRLASVIAKSSFGANNKLVQIKQRTSSVKDIPCLASLKDALRKDQKCVFLIENIDQMNISFIRSLSDALKLGYFEDTFGEVSLTDAIFILTTSTCTSTEFHDSNDNDNVIMMRFCAEDLLEVSGTKRKSENDLQNGSKKQRAEEHSFDLNVQANEDSEQDSIPTVTHEPHCTNLHLPQELLDSTAQLTLNAGCDYYQEVKLTLISKLHRAFDEVQSGKDEKGHLFIDSAVTEELTKSSAFFLVSLFENWVREVFKTSIQSVKEDVNLRLKLEGRESNAEEFSFMGSVLPNKIIVD